MGGNVRLEGERYIETPTQASVQKFDDLKVDFKWKIEGGHFIQSGTIVRPDGKIVVLEALVFKRVTSGKVNPSNPAIGTWRQLSSHQRTADGKNIPLFTANDSRLLVFTPTHWIRIDHKNRKFQRAAFGTYTMDGDDAITTTYQYPSGRNNTHKFSQHVKDNKLYTATSGVSSNGHSVFYDDILEKMD